MNNRKPEPAKPSDHPFEPVDYWTSAELDWIAKRDAQWAAWGYSLAPLTPAPEPARVDWRERVFVVGLGVFLVGVAGLMWALLS